MRTNTSFSSGGPENIKTREEVLEDAVHKTRALLREYEALTASDDHDEWSRFRDALVLYLLYEGSRLADYAEEQLL